MQLGTQSFDDNNDTLANAEVIRAVDADDFSLSGVSGIADTYTGHIGGSDTDDYYTFTNYGTGAFTITLSGLSQDIDLRLLDENGLTLQSSFHSGAANETITQAFGHGETYYIQIYPWAAAGSDYNLQLETNLNSNPDYIITDFNLHASENAEPGDEIFFSGRGVAP